MLFGRTFENYSLLAWLHRLRQRRLEAYGVALLVVALATLLRFPLVEPLAGAAPFITYTLAIIVIALVCGFLPGIMALILSVLTGWFLFLPPMFTFALSGTQAWMLVTFASVALINIVLVSGLVAALLRHETHQQLLFRELQHRSQNLFAVIQAIASRTLTDGQTVSEAKELFAGRLHALARTHSMLAKNPFSGASLKDILAQELTSFSNQTTLTGCDIAVNTRTAENFALIVHELVTNAVKYGALSTRQGRVDIQCSIEGVNGTGRLRFEWKESGGPLVNQPTRKGFGNAILFEAAKQFSHDVHAKYEPEGLTYQLRLSVSDIEAPPVQVAPLIEAADEQRRWREQNDGL